jgi:hypothetical protein
VLRGTKSDRVTYVPECIGTDLVLHRHALRPACGDERVFT